MIGYIKGQIIDQDDRFVIVLAGNVGYKVYTPHRYLEENPEVSLYTYTAVRENAIDLYGFEQKEDLKFFELLLTVSGIGPKSAITILSNSKTSNIIEAIKREDSDLLVKNTGIGRKNAEKIVLELKNKVDEFEGNEKMENQNDIIEALLSLGYAERQIREVLKKIEGENTKDKIKSALKYLSKN